MAESIRTTDEVLARWEELTGEESEAIEAGAWPRLADIQRRKAGLRTDLQHSGAPIPARMHPRVRRLMELERRNFACLGNRMDELRGQLTGLDLARSNLRRIHRSYAPRGNPNGGFRGTA